MVKNQIKISKILFLEIYTRLNCREYEIGTVYENTVLKSEER